MKKCKKIKKYVGIVMLSIFIMTMIGCNNTKKVDSQSDSVQKKEEITATDEITNSKLYDRKVQVGNKVITLPAKYTDFTKAGAALSSKDLSEDYIMDAYSTKDCDMSIGSTKLHLSLKNDSDKKDSLKNAEVQYISSTEGKDVFYTGGIHVGSKLDDLTAKWGQPSKDDSRSNDNDMIYCYYENYYIAAVACSVTGNEYTVKIDRKTSTVKDIEYKWAQADMSDTSTVKTYSQIIKPGQYTLSFEIPQYMAGQNEKMETAMYLVDNVKYVVTVPYFPTSKGSSNGNVDKEVKEYKSLFSTNTSSISILDQTSDEAHMSIYENEGKSVRLRGIYVNTDSVFETSCEITPYDGNGTVSDSAVSKFKDIVEQITKSIHQSKA